MKRGKRVQQPQNDDEGYVCGKQFFPQYPRIELCFFNGENPRDWLRKCNEFFLVYNVPDGEKLARVEYHFEGRAAVWFSGIIVSRPKISWVELAQEILRKFSEKREMNEFEELNQCSYSDNENLSGNGAANEHLEPKNALWKSAEGLILQESFSEIPVNSFWQNVELDEEQDSEKEEGEPGILLGVEEDGAEIHLNSLAGGLQRNYLFGRNGNELKLFELTEKEQNGFTVESEMAYDNGGSVEVFYEMGLVLTGINRIKMLPKPWAVYISGFRGGGQMVVASIDHEFEIVEYNLDGNFVIFLVVNVEHGTLDNRNKLLDVLTEFVVLEDVFENTKLQGPHDNGTMDDFSGEFEMIGEKVKNDDPVELLKLQSFLSLGSNVSYCLFGDLSCVDKQFDDLGLIGIIIINFKNLHKCWVMEVTAFKGGTIIIFLVLLYHEPFAFRSFECRKMVGDGMILLLGSYDFIRLKKWKNVEFIDDLVSIPNDRILIGSWGQDWFC